MKIVIIGDSAAGFSAVNILAQVSGRHEITVVSQEPYPAYRKDRLLDYLCGSITRDDLLCPGKEFYVKNRINFIGASPVVRVDIKRKNVVLKDKNRIAYDYLVIACGKKTNFPDLPGKTKDGICGFYNFDDAQKIGEKLILAGTVCITNGAGISLGLAKCIAAKGSQVKVIVSGPLTVAQAEPENIEFIAGSQLQEFIGEGPQLQAVKLSNGKVIAASLALITGDYLPSGDFLKDSGINMSNGYIVVDNMMRTSAENIFACGNIAVNSASAPVDKTWQQATDEGALAGHNLFDLITRGEPTCQAQKSS